MRKFDVRWWNGPDLEAWKIEIEAGRYKLPFIFWPMVQVDLGLWYSNETVIITSPEAARHWLLTASTLHRVVNAWDTLIPVFKKDL